MQRSKRGKGGIENHAKYEDISRRTCWTIFSNAVEQYYLKRDPQTSGINVTLELARNEDLCASSRSTESQSFGVRAQKSVYLALRVIFMHSWSLRNNIVAYFWKMSCCWHNLSSLILRRFQEFGSRILPELCCREIIKLNC